MKLQRGFLSLTLVILLVIFATLATIVAHFYVASNLSLANNLQSERAYYLAQAGVEHGTRAWKLSSAYAGDIATALGAGTYSVQVFNTDFSGSALAANQKRIRGTGVVGNTTRVVEAIVQNNTGTELITSGNFDGINCSSPLPWTLATSGQNGVCGTGQGIGATNAVRVEKSSGNANVIRTSTAVQTLATPVTTIAANTTFTVNYQYQIPTYNGNRSVSLVAALNGGLFTSNTTTLTASQPSYTSGTLTINVPSSGTLITAFRLTLNATGSSTKVLRVDNVSMQNPIVGNMILLDWREVFP